MNGPRVTVYLPTHERAAQLETAVRSVLAQDYADFELIVVDDASSDATPRVLERLAAADARLRVLRTAQSVGPARARNLAIREACGEFVTGLDDDDLMTPERLRTLLAAYREEYAFVCSAYRLAGPGGERRVGARRALIRLADLLHRNVVGNQVLTRTERLRELGGFDEGFVASEDYDLWTRLVLRYGPALRIAATTLIVQEHEAGPRITTSHRAVEGARQYYERYLPRMTAAQRRSQRLLRIATEGRRLSFREAPGCWAWPTQGALLRYLLAGPRLTSRGG